MKPALVLLAASLLAGPARPIAGSSLLARWMATSRVTPSEAARTLAVEDEETVRPNALFEARKHLRSDGRLSMAEHVLRESFRARLGMLLGAEPPAASMPPPMLHWLEWRPTPDGLELTGESAQAVRVSGDGDRSVVVFDHRSIHEVWTECDIDLCVRRLPSPPPAGDEAYRLVLPRGQDAPVCAPVPSTVQAADEDADVFVWEASPWQREAPLRRIVCELRGRRAAAGSRWELFRDGRLARPPAAAPSSVGNNPLELGGGEANVAPRHASARIDGLAP